MSPPRQSICDRFDGHLLRADGVALLSALNHSGEELLAPGPLRLRYGIVCLETPQRCIVPELVVMEYGELLTGEAAWDFLLHHSNLHPRAEVHGRLDDGMEDQLRVSRLDLALRPRVLAWPESAADSTVPLARPVALLGAAPHALPSRLTQCIPVYPGLAAWRHERP